MNHSLFLHSFDVDHMPAWPCPHCKAEALIIVKDTYISKVSNENYQMEGGDCLDFEIVWTAIFKCYACDVRVATLGDGSVSYKCPGAKPETFLNLRHCRPAIPIIKTDNDESIPLDIMTLLKSSFELFWFDPDACANRIRTTLEAILDNQNISDKTEKKLSLHDRINKFDGQEFDEIRKFMLAIKWLGNSGSHEINGLEKKDVLTAYELLEYCLNFFYSKAKKRLLEAANAINTAKGPTPKTVRSKNEAVVQHSSLHEGNDTCVD